MMLLLYANVRQILVQYNFVYFSFLLVPNVVNSNCTTNELRLTGGSNQYEGRVEYCVNGVWQSFCDYSWDDSDAYTVCRQLGYQGVVIL